MSRAGNAARISGAAGVRAIEAGAASLSPSTPMWRSCCRPISRRCSKAAPKLAGTATVDAQTRIGIETLTARAAGFGAGAKGTFDTQAMSADLAFGVNVGEAARFSALAPGVAWNSLAIEGTVKGAVAARPWWRRSPGKA